MDPTFKAAELGEFSDDSDELEHVPEHILASVGSAPLSPTHTTGHVTPGHVVGRPIHDSPKQHHVEIHLDTPESHLGGLHAKVQFYYTSNLFAYGSRRSTPRLPALTDDVSLLVITLLMLTIVS
jgi:hypothetical protein